jgi:endo-1,4-beta-xylanase
MSLAKMVYLVKTFISNGVEYSTYRTLREEKPSINSTSTFYQYWSKPN